VCAVPNGGTGLRALWPGLTPVLRDVVVGLSLVNVEPLRIGMGGESPEMLVHDVDQPLLRRRIFAGKGGEPYIPGSSMKGVLRTASLIVASGSGLPLHSALFGDWCGAEVADAADAGNYTFLRNIIYKSEGPSVMYEVLRSFCPTCLLYGGPGLAGRLQVSDFDVDNNVGWRIGRRTSVAINRRTGSAAKGRLFSYEYVEPNAVFRGQLRIVNAPTWLLSFLAASLMLLDEGVVKVGGFKSRGMGRVKIKEDDVRVVVRDYVDGVLDEEIDSPLI